MSQNTTTTKQFKHKLINYINSHYNKHFVVKHIDKIRFTSYHIAVYINADAGNFYYINYNDFDTFTY